MALPGTTGWTASAALIKSAAALAIELWDYGFMRFSPECLGWSEQLMEAAPDAGRLAGVIRSQSGAYRGQLLVFLRDEAGRTVGVISHVTEMKEQIGTRIDIIKNINGSHTKIVLP